MLSLQSYYTNHTIEHSNKFDENVRTLFAHIAQTKDTLKIGKDVIEFKEFEKAYNQLTSKQQQQHKKQSDESDNTATTIYIPLDDEHIQYNQYIITLSNSIHNTTSFDDTTTIPVSCSCPNHLYRLVVCKHMIAIYIILRTKGIRPEDIHKVLTY